jgi:hypothetical protein
MTDEFNQGACDATHTAISESLSRIEAGIGKQTERVDKLSVNVGKLRGTVETSDWGRNPYPAPGEPSPKPGDTEELVRNVSGIVRFGAKYRKALLYIAAITGIMGSASISSAVSDFLGGSDTQASVSQEDLDEAAAAIAEKALAEIIKELPPRQHK